MQGDSRGKRPIWAEALRQRRLGRRWSQEALAAQLRRGAVQQGQPVPDIESVLRNVKRWEAGDYRPGDFYLGLLASAYGVRPEDVFQLDRPALDIAGQDRMAYALAHPGAIDQHQIDDLATLMQLYAQNAKSMAPSILLGVVQDLMSRVRWLMTGSLQESARHRLMLIYAEAAAVAGRVAYWNDDRGQASRLLKTANDLAVELNEPHLQALALAFRGDLYSTVPFIGTIPNNTPLALRMFDEAASLDAPDTPPLLRSWIDGCRAEEHAIQRRSLDSDREMERAHTALASARPGIGSDQVVDVAALDVAGLDVAAAGLNGFDGACAIALGRGAAARAAFGAGLRSGSSGGWLSGLAAASALEGDAESAADLLSQELTHAMQRGLANRLRRIEGVRAMYLSPADDHPAVQRFDEQLRAAIG